MILQHRRTLRSGFGLPVRPQDSPLMPVPVGQPPIACGEDLCGLCERTQREATMPNAAMDLEEEARFQ